MNKTLFSLILIIVALVLFGCQLTGNGPISVFSDPDEEQPSNVRTSQPPSQSTPSRVPKTEAIPGLAGKWEYYDANGRLLYDIVIEWNGDGYIVRDCVGYASVICEIQSQSWDGVTLEWTNYYPNTNYTTKHTFLNLSDDTLTVARSGTGGEGITIYQRAP